MEHDYGDDVSDGSGLTAIKLSLVGGFVGTLAGLKRRGIGGAVVGGLVGGTTGYVAGTALDGSDTAEEWEDPLTDVRDDPVTVDVGADDDDDGGFDFDAGDGDGDEGEGDEAEDEGADDDEAEAEDADDEDEDDENEE